MRSNKTTSLYGPSNAKFIKCIYRSFWEARWLRHSTNTKSVNSEILKGTFWYSVLLSLSNMLFDESWDFEDKITCNPPTSCRRLYRWQRRGLDLGKWKLDLDTTKFICFTFISRKQTVVIKVDLPVHHTRIWLFWHVFRWLRRAKPASWKNPLKFSEIGVFLLSIISFFVRCIDS